jgi:hypothetical protein
MTTDSILTKRRAHYKGEVGLFPDNEMAADDLALATMNTEVICRWYSPPTLKKLKFLWTMVYKAWQNTDFWLDHHEAMIDLKTRIHFTRVRQVGPKVEAKPRSLTRINDEQLRLVTDRIADVICTEVMPGMEKNQLYKEIEEMTGVSSR